MKKIFFQRNFSSINILLPIFVWMLKPVPVVILVSPLSKQKFAKNEACASPATPIIGIDFSNALLKSLSPKIFELLSILGRLRLLPSKIFNKFWSQEFSKQLNKPIIIHCRDSFQDTYDLLVEFNNPSSVILHSWTGGRKWTKRFRELDVYFSISGIVTYETAKDLQLSVQEIPINRLLLETDTPYLTPMPLKGQDNRPNFIEHTASKISSLLDIDENKLSEITIRNSRELLKR